MSQKTYTLDELFAQDEEERLAKTRAEMAAEKAAWDALPQEEKDRINAEREAYWDQFETPADVDDDEDEEEDDDDE